MSKPDLILVGGGLANGLIAYRIAQMRPDLSILLIERGHCLGGNHTWSFHATDVTREQLDWLAPFIAHRWDGYYVRFPDIWRSLSTEYCSITSERLHAVISDALGPTVRTGAEVASTGPTDVVLASGERLTANGVIDGRGPEHGHGLSVGFQKFLGQEVRLARPHGLARPVLMDATVTQDDGYRFVYVLPFDERRVLIEDTYYADAPELDAPVLRHRIAEYAASHGWTIECVEREEQGLLPVTLGGDIEAFWDAKTANLPAVGLRGAFFHATTSYSLPDAARVADLVARQARLEPEALYRALRAHSADHWRRQSFYRLLNRMLFRAAQPDHRYEVLQRFYRLPQPLVERFYGGRSTVLDKARILAGKPPVKLRPALRALRPVSINATTDEARA